MHSEANPPRSLPYSWPQRLGAIGIAVASDIVGALFTWAPPIVIAVDVVTATLLWLVLGRPMVLLPIFIAEAVPGASIVPLWTLVAVGLAFFGRIPGRGRLDAPSPTDQQADRDATAPNPPSGKVR